MLPVPTDLLAMQVGIISEFHCLIGQNVPRGSLLCYVNIGAMFLKLSMLPSNRCHGNKRIHDIKMLKCALKHDVRLRGTLLYHNNHFLSPYLLL